MVDYIQCPEPQNKQIHKPEYNKLHYLPTGNPSKGLQPSMVTSTIPTKYQTVMYEIAEKKGFGSQARRFDDDLSQSENPGPGTYDYTHGSLETFSTSFSKRGMGGLASKVPRVERRKIIQSPGANAYNVPSTILTKMDYHLGNSSMFQPPIAMKVDGNKNRTPGPNEYNISNVFLGKANNVSAESAFLSKTRREAVPQGVLHGPSPLRRNPTPPGPGYYDVVDFHDPPKRYMTSAVFVSNTSRWTGNVHDKDIPGPASYVPKKNEKQSFLYNVNRKWVPL